MTPVTLTFDTPCHGSAQLSQIGKETRIEHAARADLEGGAPGAKIGHLNTRSLYPKIDEIRCIVDKIILTFVVSVKLGYMST